MAEPTAEQSGGKDTLLPLAQAPVKASPVRPEAYLRLFENAYDATLITDNQGCYINSNRRVTKMLGYDQQALQQINFWQLVSGADASLMETVRQSLASERFLRISAWCVRQDGTRFPAEIAVNQFLSDDKTFFCFFIRDETLRTQAEAQLRTIQNAVRNASAGIGVAGLDGTMQYVNATLAALFGESNSRQLKGRSLSSLLQNEKLVRELIDAITEGQSALVEISVPLPDGTLRWIQIAAAPNIDSDDVLIGMVLSLVDISDRRRAEQAERVVERDKIMMESLGAMCHHLGQPATVLLSTLEMLSRTTESDLVSRKDLLQMSLDAADSLRKTLLKLNDLRHYSAEPYPGPTAEQASSIVSVQRPA
ncbi:MAG: PAS domain-containing protein [Kiritimatiellia bacterium]